MNAQQRDEMLDASKDRCVLQYHFPPSSVGETGRVGAPGCCKVKDLFILCVACLNKMRGCCRLGGGCTAAG